MKTATLAGEGKYVLMAVSSPHLTRAKPLHRWLQSSTGRLTFGDKNKKIPEPLKWFFVAPDKRFHMILKAPIVIGSCELRSRYGASSKCGIRRLRGLKSYSTHCTKYLSYALPEQNVQREFVHEGRPSCTYPMDHVRPLQLGVSTPLPSSPPAA